MTSGSGRTRLAEVVDRLCRGETAAGDAELTDLSAYLIALGAVSAEVRSIVLRRYRQRLGMPTLGGFHKLRGLDEHRLEARQVAETAPSSVVRLAARSRLADLDRRHNVMRNEFIRGGGVYSQKVRDIRADRKRGVHLEIAQREELFVALCSTPTVVPAPLTPHTLGELGAVAAARGQREVGRVTLPNGLRTIVDAFPRPEPAPTVRPLPEMYTAVLMHVGRLYDRLQLAYHRGGRALDEVRLQFDAESEVIGLSTDLCRLREAARTAGVASEAGFSEKTGMSDAIDGIWSEVVDRAAAFAELVETAEGRAEQMRRHEQRVRPPVDPVADVTDRLVSGAGDRMLSTEAMRRIRGQIDPGRE